MNNSEYLKQLAERGDGSLQEWFDAEHVEGVGTHESREDYEERLYNVKVSDCPYCGCSRVVIHDFCDAYEHPHSYRVEHVDEREAFNCECFESYFAFDSIEKAVEHADMRDGEKDEHPKNLYVSAEDFELLEASLRGEPGNGPGQDSREKLIAEVREWANYFNSALDDDYSEEVINEGHIARIHGWLDRVFLLGRASLDDEFAEMQADREAEHALVVQFEHDNELLKHTNAELYKQVESLCAEVDWLEESVDALKGKRDELMDENDYWRNEVHLCLLAACDKNKRGYAPEVMEYPLPDGYTTPSTLVTSEIDHLRDFYADLKKENDALLAAHTDDVNRLDGMGEGELLREIEELKRERDAYHEEVCGLKIELARSQGNLKNTTDNHAAAKAKYERAQADAMRAREKQLEAERKYAELLEKPPEGAWAEKTEMLEATIEGWRKGIGDILDACHEVQRVASFIGDAHIDGPIYI